MVASVSNITSASSTVQYFEKDGYYSKNDPEHRKASRWVGQGTAQLGLHGHIDPARFRSILEGYVPQTDIRLGRIRDGEHEHRAGVDLTLSAPKSVSLEALVHGNDQVQSAHDGSMQETLDFVEDRILQSWVWNGVQRKRERVNMPTMVAATFRHAASRNLDPQLHTHCVIANMTCDANGKWRSIETGDLKRNEKLIGAFYRNELARRLRELGFALAPTMIGHIPGFEIAGRSQVVLEAFSTRRRDMLDHIAEKGWEYNAKRTRQAALATRLRKDEPHWEVLTALWQQRAEKFGLERTERYGARESLPTPSPLEIVWQAAEHLEEQPPVFAQRDLTTLTLGHIAGRHTITAVDAAVERMRMDGHLIAGIRRGIGASFVTDRTVRAERDLVALMQKGIGAAAPLVPAEIVKKQLAVTALTEGQRDSARIILASDDRVVGVQVYAGIGKTAMLREVTALAADQSIFGLAPSVGVTRTLARETGIACRTLQGFLARHRDVIDNLVGEEQLVKLRRDFAGSIVVADEVSRASTEQVRRLIRVSDCLGVGRLVLIGDRRQLRAVGAGQPFRQLREAGMQMALMDDIRRQRSPQLKAVALDVLGEVSESMPGSASGQLGENLYQVSAGRLGERAAQIWLELLPEARARTAIVAPTGSLRERINATVREGLEEEGALRGRELVIETLVDLGLTQAQKNDMRNWHEGDIAVFHNDLSHSRIRAGDICTVATVDNQRVWLHHADGKPRHITLPGASRYRLELCEMTPIRIRAGDRIRWTRDDRERKLTDGEQAAVSSINRHTLSLGTDDGRALEFKHDDLQLRYIAHAYASTMHMARALEEDVIAVLDSGHGSLDNQQMFYLEISRTGSDAVVLTDNRQQLMEMLQENIDKQYSQFRDQGGDEAATRLRQRQRYEALISRWNNITDSASADNVSPFGLKDCSAVISAMRTMSTSADLTAGEKEALQLIVRQYDQHISRSLDMEMDW